MLDINEIRKTDSKVVNEISCKITSIMKGILPADSRQNFVLVYAAYVALINDIDDVEDLLSFIEDNVSEQRALFVKEIARENIEVAIQLSKAFSDRDLLAYMMIFPRESFGRISGEYGTPESLSKLTSKILDIQDGDRIADFGSGVGDFISLISENNSRNSVYGIELNTYSYEISKIRAELFSENIDV